METTDEIMTHVAKRYHAIQIDGDRTARNLGISRQVGILCELIADLRAEIRTLKQDIGSLQSGVGNLAERTSCLQVYGGSKP